MAQNGYSSGSRVVIVGGGFGGLETAFALRMAIGRRAQITLVSDRDSFLFKPNSIYVPFGLDPEKLKVPIAPAARRKGIEFVRGSIEGVDADKGTIAAGGRQIPYDRLVLATGAAMRAEEVPGMAEHAVTPWTPVEMLGLRAGFQGLLDAAGAGERRRVLFLVPPHNKCAGPLYEIVLMLDTWLRRKGVRDSVEITWSTFEQSYIQAFGPRLHEVAAGEFDRRGIAGHSGWLVEGVEPGTVSYANGEQLPFDLLVAFPPYVAATPFEGLDSDDRGFLLTDLATRRLIGHPEIFAVGDAADFPVKQAFLAFLQADAAAAQIAGEILGTEPALTFDPVSMCVMEQFDKATFAQVPLRLTGDPERPIEVRPDADGQYLVGSSKAWRAGKKVLGHAVPMRFSRGEPFHGGNFWRGMDTGLKAMARVLAA